MKKKVVLSILFSKFVARPCGTIIKVSTIVGNESNDIVSDLESLVKDVNSGGVVTIRIYQLLSNSKKIW